MAVDIMQYFTSCTHEESIDKLFHFQDFGYQFSTLSGRQTFFYRFSSENFAQPSLPEMIYIQLLHKLSIHYLDLTPNSRNY